MEVKRNGGFVSSSCRPAESRLLLMGADIKVVLEALEINVSQRLHQNICGIFLRPYR
jgi:hypothetical protein